MVCFSSQQNVNHILGSPLDHTRPPQLYLLQVPWHLKPTLFLTCPPSILTFFSFNPSAHAVGQISTERPGILHKITCSLLDFIHSCQADKSAQPASSPQSFSFSFFFLCTTSRKTNSQIWLAHRFIERCSVYYVSVSIVTDHSQWLV